MKHVTYGLPPDHRVRKADRELGRLIKKTSLTDAERFNLFYLTSEDEQRDRYNGARFD